jgi:hypothetical protein
MPLILYGRRSRSHIVPLGCCQLPNALPAIPVEATILGIEFSDPLMVVGTKLFITYSTVGRSLSGSNNGVNPSRTLSSLIDWAPSSSPLILTRSLRRQSIATDFEVAIFTLSSCVGPEDIIKDGVSRNDIVLTLVGASSAYTDFAREMGPVMSF